MTIVVRSVFEDKDKFYPQIYLKKCLWVINTRTQQNKYFR